MKLKYYMRGVGIGVVVTTIILVVAFAFIGNNMSDEEIVARAKKLGMVESNTTKTDTTMSGTKNTTNSTEQEGNTTINGATNPMPNSASGNDTNAEPVLAEETVEFTISDGDVSRTVIERLVAQGIITDGDGFNRYLQDKGYDNNLQNGTFHIKKGISQEDLANLLVTKQQFRQ